MSTVCLRKIPSLEVLGFLCACIAGCATPYEKSFTDFQISNEVFSLTAKGNQFTSEETVERYLFRRASELTLQHGFRFFEFIGSEDRTRVGSYFSSSGQSTSYGQGQTLTTHGFGSGYAMPIVKPGKAVWLRCYRERPESTGVVVDAEEFLHTNYPEALPTSRPER